MLSQIWESIRVKIIKRKLLIILMLFLLLGTVIGMFFHKSKDTIEYNQICSSDYTRFNYNGKDYFYQSSADYFYLYKSNENGEKKECLAQQVPREIYMINNQVFFTNMSDGQTLYRINTDGSKLEQVLKHRINRMVPVNESFYYISAEDGYIYSWSEEQGTNLLYGEKCNWLSTDGRFLYIELMDESKEDKTFCTIVMDSSGNIISQFSEWFYACLPDQQLLYYLENNTLMSISCLTNEKNEITRIPIHTEQEAVAGMNQWKDNIYVMCYENGDGTYYLYEYNLNTDLWRTVNTGSLSGSDWSYKGFSDFHIADGKVFFKKMAGEGKGELWYWICIKTGEADFFEDMQPFENVNVLQEDFMTMCQGATEQSRFYLDRDLAYEETKMDEGGNLIKTQLLLPKLNQNIAAYQKINQKIQQDAEDFYEEQMEFASYIKNAADEWEKESSGNWQYIYAYADPDYVSVVYWKFIGRNGLSDIKEDKYEVRLYSSITGEEINIADLFSISKNEMLLRLSYAIRKTDEGIRFFYDDMELLDRHESDNQSYKSYYILTKKGINIFFVERVRTHIKSFIIDFNELDDIMIRK